MQKSLICISCPLGCPMTVEQAENGAILSISGNTCRRGAVYAEKELTAPTRIVTSIVKLAPNPYNTATVSCKTKSDIPKEKIFDITHALKHIVVTPPIAIGDVICANVADTGVDIVATRSVK